MLAHLLYIGRDGDEEHHDVLLYKKDTYTRKYVKIINKFVNKKLDVILFTLKLGELFRLSYC